MVDIFKARPSGGKPALAATVLLAVAGLALLSAVVSAQASDDLDLQISQWARALYIPGLDAVSALVGFFTDTLVAMALWLIATALFVLRGRPLEGIAVLSIGGLWLASSFLSAAMERPAPSTEISGAIGFSQSESGSFPSGQVTGAAAFYGLLTFLTFSNLRRGNLRIFVPVLAVSIIGITSLSKVYVGDHWFSDILGSYLLGFIGVAGIAWVYVTVKADRLHLPRLRKRQLASTADGVRVARSIASMVYLDSRAGTATKEYSPPWPVRAIYWLAFQAPFPYQGRMDALEAAAAKRKIVGLLTKYRYGRDIVASVYGIRNGGSGYRFVTELVPGSEPQSNSEIESTLSDLYSYFQEVGLPTWQIAPGNPHAYSNFIRNPHGELKLIDLESSIVSFSPSFGVLRSALRDGNFPVFDDVDFVRLREYVTEHASGLSRSLGPEGFDELNRAIEAVRDSSHSWKQSEPRIWGRLAQRGYRILDMSRVLEGVRRSLDSAEATAKAFLNSAVDRWEREGRVDGVRAASLRGSLETSETDLLLKHLGAHFVLSLALRFPLGSLLRFGWVVAFRIRSRYDLAKARTTPEQYAVARSLHSVPVMLISLVPGLGTIAYFASGAVRKSGVARMLIDQFAYMLPFGLYRRLGLAHIAAPRIPKPSLRERIAPNAVAAYRRLTRFVHATVRVARGIVNRTRGHAPIPRSGF